MIKTSFLTVLTLAFFIAFGQQKEKEFEIFPYWKWDSYPSFISQTGPTLKATIRLKGFSWGIISSYKHAFVPNLVAKVGIGFHQYSFNNIKRTDIFGTFQSRAIDYNDGSTRLGHTTEKYWYNSIVLTFGVDRIFDLPNNAAFTFGASVDNYYTFSQHYNITNLNSGLETSVNRYFGFCASVNTGIQKRIQKRLSVGPSFSMPVFTLWKQDRVFPSEKNSNTRDKWWDGIDFGVRLCYFLTKP